MSSNAQRFREHVKVRTTPPPRTLYKYVTVETARKILSSMKLRWQTPLQFNDPFDAQWNVLWPLWTPEFNSALERRWREALHNGKPSETRYPLRAELEETKQELDRARPDRRAEMTDAYMRSFMEAMRDAELNRPPKEFFDLLQRIRVLCFSDCRKSLPMWSYYADQHKGVVLEFDSHLLEEAWTVPVEVVEYRPDLPTTIDVDAHVDSFIYDFEVEDDHEKIVRAWTLTKADCWKHEQEWRFVCLANKKDASDRFTDLTFPAVALLGITMGCRADPQQRRAIDTIVQQRYPAAQMRQADRHNHRFAIDIRPM